MANSQIPASAWDWNLVIWLLMLLLILLAVIYPISQCVEQVITYFWIHVILDAVYDELFFFAYRNRNCLAPSCTADCSDCRFRSPSFQV